MKRSLILIPFVLMFAMLACGSPTAPVLSQITPNLLTVPTFYENDNTQGFVLTGERFEQGVIVLVGYDADPYSALGQLQPQTITPTSITVWVPPTYLNPEFPQNIGQSIQIPFRVKNPNGQTSNTVLITVVAHCNPCGT